MSLAELPIADIKVRDGFNPRQSYDKAELAQLAESIRTRGLLQPITVTPNDSGYYVVAGHRRFLACQDAGLTHIPAQIRADAETGSADVGEGEALIDAIVENSHRVDLTATEEADAIARLKAQRYSNKEIAAQLGISQKLVTERLKLAALGSMAKGAIAAGAIPLSEVGQLLAMHQVSPQLAEAAAGKFWELVQDEKVYPDDARQGILDEIAPIADPELGIWILANRGQVHVREEWATTKALKALQEAKMLGDHRDAEFVQIKRDTFEQGVAGKFVYIDDRSEGAWNFTPAIVDAEWLKAAVEDEAKMRLREARATAKRRAEAKGVDAGDVDVNAEPKSEEEVKAEKRAQREAEMDHRLVVHDRNQQLGADLFAKLGKLEVTRDVALTLVDLVLAHDIGPILSAGVGYCFPHLLVTEQPKKEGGRPKHVYAFEDAQLWGYEYITGGETAEDVLARLVQVLAAAAFADQECVAQSNRFDKGWVVGWKAAIASLVPAAVTLPDVEAGYRERARADWLASARRQREEGQASPQAPSDEAPQGDPAPEPVEA